MRKRIMSKSNFLATILTLFPEMFPGPLGQSLSGRALQDGVWNLETINIRDFTADKHKTVDDTPCGGGAGMVMKPDVLDKAILSIKSQGRFIYMSPRGKVLDQDLAKELAQEEHLTILCGRYEGVDQRVLDAHNAEEISIGDYVLSGGEPAAMILLDTCIRLLPGVMGNTETTDEESFENGLLEYPLYTRPTVWTDSNGIERKVPETLISGHHKNIRKWRLEQSEAITQKQRPDLWAKYKKN